MLTTPKVVVDVLLEAIRNTFKDDQVRLVWKGTITMKNSVAIVTGASQGIGRSTALRLAQDFSSLVLAARNGDALKEVAKAVVQAGVQVLPLPLDLRKPAADKALVDETLNRFGRIDALINIAGAVPQIDLSRDDRCPVG